MNSEPANHPNPAHWRWFGFVLLLGLGFRMWRLASKPLWVDEVITSIFSLGRSFKDLPLDQALPLAALPELFTLNTETSCVAIATHLATESTHPPLFFCLLHSWLMALTPWTESLAWQLRSFSVMWGVGAIAAIYLLNRVAFSPRAALYGAGVMALSPFAVYLSQEARHYTLPITLITLALTCQIKLLQQLPLGKPRQGRSQLWLWFAWGTCHTVALYSHYFCLLAIASQLVLLGLFCWRYRVRFPVRGILLYAFPLLAFIPWLPTFWQHFNSPKTGWLSAPSGLSPLFQTFAGWVVMLVSFPVERQPLAVQIGMGVLMLVSVSLLLRWAIAGFRQLPDSPGRFVLVGFVLLTIGEFFGIVYLLQKDITIAPRYHFVYFPAICALLGAALSRLGGQGRKSRSSAWKWSAAILGLSSICVVWNLAFQKPYAPEFVAQQFNATSTPVAVMMAHHNTLEVAVGLSYGLALARIRTAPTDFMLVEFTDTLEGIWQTLAQLAIAPHYLWVIAPGYLDDSFPETAILIHQQQCERETDQIHRIGFPYQRYQCRPD